MENVGFVIILLTLPFEDSISHDYSMTCVCHVCLARWLCLTAGTKASNHCKRVSKGNELFRDIVLAIAAMVEKNEKEIDMRSKKIRDQLRTVVS